MAPATEASELRFLVTGGTGFIGRKLCRTLVSAGHHVTVLSRSPNRVRQTCGETATPITDLGALGRQERFHGIVNLAGEPIFGPRWSTTRKQIIWDSRVRLTDQLVGFIADTDCKPGVLLSASAIGVYGNQGDRLLDESSAAVDGFSHRLCSAWESSAMRACEFGVRVCTLRTGLVLGPSGGFLERLLPPFRLGLGGRLGSGEQWMSWIHLDDHVAAMTTLLNSTELSGTFNLTAPDPVTNAGFTACLAELLGRPARCHIPAAVLRLLFGEMAELLLDSQRVIPARLMAAGFQFRHPSLASALADVLNRR